MCRGPARHLGYQRVSRAGALANNQAAAVSLDSCRKCGRRRLLAGNASAEVLVLTVLIVFHSIGMCLEEILV